MRLMCDGGIAMRMISNPITFMVVGAYKWLYGWSTDKINVNVVVALDWRVVTDSLNEEK